MTVSRALRLRLLTPKDLDFADQVRELEGWNQTRTDWERLLGMEPRGCFVAEWNGQPVGTATTTVYSPELAWIGMVLVHPDYRRRGIGRSLLEHCVGHLRERNVRCIKLDATPLGMSVYRTLGFKEEWPVTRWVWNKVSMPASNRSSRVKPWQPPDTAALAPMDTAAFGASRHSLLLALNSDNREALRQESIQGDLTAFGLVRAGAKALYLGPVIAASAEEGLALIERLLARCEGESLIWDIPDRNIAAKQWAQGHGLMAQRPLTRMFLGENQNPGDPTRQFALAGPELG